MSKTAAEIYREMMANMPAVPPGRAGVETQKKRLQIFRGPRGEVGIQPIYRGQEPEREE